MKCPIDQTEMKQGELRGYMRGPSFIKRTRSFWSLKMSDPLYVYYCPKCGKIEFATEPDKEGDK